MNTKKLLMLGALSAQILALAPAGAATYYWAASSGLWPNQVDPAMTVTWGPDPACQPSLTTNYLTLVTPAGVFGGSEGCLVDQWGTNLTAPAKFVLETEVQVVRSAARPDLGSTFPPSGVSINVAFAPSTTFGILLEVGRITIPANGGATRGPTASVDTTSTFHKYRIEADSPTNVGSAFRVYYDGVLVLSSTVIGEPVALSQVYFGNGSSLSSGLSYWKSFKHNAATSFPLVITNQPQSQVGYWGSSATFAVAASSANPPLSYQWQQNGTPVANANSSSLVLTNLQTTNGGSYTVVVTDATGRIVVSDPATLTVNVAAVNLALYAGVTINGVVGKTYGIQSLTNLGNANFWVGRTNITLSAPTFLWEDTQPTTTQPNSYYRVVQGPITIP